MRLLHTSDWHLGQVFHGHDRQFEHEQFLSWLLDTLEREKVDVLLLAGDVFDGANPPSAAQRLYYGFLAQAAQRMPGLQVVVIAGNHDSPTRLEAPSPALAALDVTVVGQARDEAGQIEIDRLVVPLHRRGEPQIAAWCLAVPFLRPGDVPRVEAEGDVYAQGIAALYQQALDTAIARREPGQAIIAMGHCHLAGGAVSEHSERSIVIGGTESVPSSVFTADIAYAALGHLHLAQQAAGRDTVRYSGSPLPLSFAETHYPHQVLVIDLDGAAVCEVRGLPVPRSVDLRREPSAYLPLDRVLSQLQALELEPLPEPRHPYLEVRVQLDGPEPGLRSRVESALANKPVRLARIDARAAKAAGAEDSAPLALGDLSELDPVAIFTRLYRDRAGTQAPPDVLGAFAELLQAAPQEAAQ